MEDQVLSFGAYGLIFILGMALVLRPLVILTSLILRPGFLALSALLALGVMSAPAESAPILAGAVTAFVIGSAVGFPLRFLARGGV